MEASKFITLLRTLTENEIAAFDKYLKKMYDSERIARSVFAYVRKFHPGLRDEKKLDTAYAYRKIFGGGLEENAYNRLKLLNALSDLHGWLRDFLLAEEMKKGSFESRVLWLNVLRKRGMDAEFARQATRLRDDIDAIPKKGVSEYLQGMFAHHWAHQLSRLPDDPSLLHAAKGLDVYYLASRLKKACETAHLNQVAATGFDLAAMPLVIGLCDLQSPADHPLLFIYREVYQLITGGQADCYDTIETMLTENIHRIPGEEAHVVIRYLNNYASGKIREGQADFWKKSHRLNRFGVKHAVFTCTGEMTTTQFNNIVTVACMMEDFDWASNFVASQGLFLSKNIRQDTVLLANAIILFVQKLFERVIAMLKDYHFADDFDLIRSKALILRCYYELGEDDATLLDFCYAYKQFLIRHQKLKKGTVQALLNFLKIMEKLIRKKAGKAAIIAEINTVKPLLLQSWLLEKAAEYKDELAPVRRNR